jgi:hypothetical protein
VIESRLMGAAAQRCTGIPLIHAGRDFAFTSAHD